MPIYAVGPLSGRSLDFGKITECKSKVRWLGKSNDRQDTPQAVFNQVTSSPYNLPVIPYYSFNPYVSAPLQLCRGVSCEQDSSAPLKWIIEAEYSSEPHKAGDENQPENPLDKPPEVKWKASQYRLPIFRDKDGKAVVNSVGDYFDPPVEIDASRWVVTVEKNVISVPPDIINYADAINENAFSVSGVSVAPHVAKLMDLDISERKTAKIANQQGQEITIFYYTFGYGMEMRAETWVIKVLNQGYQAKSVSEGVVQADVMRIMDSSRPPRPVSSPAMLNEDGTIVAEPGPDTAVFLDFNVYTPRDFSILPGINQLGT